MSRINIGDLLDESSQTLAQKDYIEIRRAQREDKTIERWRIAVLDGTLPKTFMEKEDLTIKKQLKKFKVKRGILYRTLSSPDSDSVQDQLVIPKSYRQEVLRSLHNEVGHPGQDRTSRLVRDGFFWPGMGSDIVKWVTGCDRCIRTPYLLELVCIDYLNYVRVIQRKRRKRTSDNRSLH